MVTRVRIDRLLVERGLAPSRERAAGLVLAGDVRVEGRPVAKAGALVPAAASVEVRPRSPYVGRGGEKLAHALDRFEVPVAGRVCLDVGASTGGFTDCLLGRGAAHVYAVDVGTGQLHHRLRTDPRVTVMERLNARHLVPSLFPTRPSLAVIDVSFISLAHVLPAVAAVLGGAGEVVALVKPQFEVGRGLVGKGGVVRDPVLHRSVLAKVATGATRAGWHVAGVTASPLRGPKGNREFFLHLTRHGRALADLEPAIAAAVEPPP